MIPRVVHRLWLGGEEPEWLRRFAASWERPGWELRRWTDQNVGELFPLRNQALYDRAGAIAPAHVGQLRSDVLRYEILQRFGGVYVDADLECLRPIDELLAGAECFAAWEEQGRWIANGLMGARRGHPFMERLVAGLPASVKAGAGGRPNRISGPHYLTSTWRRFGAGVRILPQAAIYPYGWREIAEHGPGEAWPDAYTVHHWLNMRRERGVPCPT